MKSSIDKVPVNNIASADEGKDLSSTQSQRVHGAPELTGPDNNANTACSEGVRTVEEIEDREKGSFAYFKTRNLYIVLVLGYVARDILVLICFREIDREHPAKF